MLIPFGVLSAAGAGGGVAVAYELIQSEILSGTQATITFNNLNNYAGDYDHLQIRWTARTNRGTDAADILSISFNGSAMTKTHMLWGDGSTAASSADLFGLKNIGMPAGPNFPTNAYGAGVIDILDVYSTTKNKTVRSFHGLAQSGGAFRSVGLASAFLNSTTAISSITLSVQASFITGSRFSIYGIRG